MRKRNWEWIRFNLVEDRQGAVSLSRGGICKNTMMQENSATFLVQLTPTSSPFPSSYFELPTSPAKNALATSSDLYTLAV